MGKEYKRTRSQAKMIQKKEDNFKSYTKNKTCFNRVQIVIYF